MCFPLLPCHIDHRILEICKRCVPFSWLYISKDLCLELSFGDLETDLTISFPERFETDTKGYKTRKSDACYQYEFLFHFLGHSFLFTLLMLNILAKRRIGWKSCNSVMPSCRSFCIYISLTVGIQMQIGSLKRTKNGRVRL